MPTGASPLRISVQAPAAPVREPQAGHPGGPPDSARPVQQGPPPARGVAGRASSACCTPSSFPPRRCRRPRRLWHSRFRPMPPESAPSLVRPPSSRQAWPAVRWRRKPPSIDLNCGPEVGARSIRNRPVERRVRPRSTCPLKCGCRAASVPFPVRTPRGTGLPQAQVAEPIDGRGRYRGQGTRRGGEPCPITPARQGLSTPEFLPACDLTR